MIFLLRPGEEQILSMAFSHFQRCFVLGMRTRGAHRLRTSSACREAFFPESLLYHGGAHAENSVLAAHEQEIEENLMGVSCNSTSLSPRGMQKQSARGFQQRRWSLISHLLLLGTTRWNAATSWAGGRGPGQALCLGSWLGLEEKPRLTGTNKGILTTKLPWTPSPASWSDAVIYKLKVAYSYK